MNMKPSRASWRWTLGLILTLFLTPGVTAQSGDLLTALGELGIQAQETEFGDYELSDGRFRVQLSGIPTPVASPENIAFTRQLFSALNDTELFEPRNIRLTLGQQDARAVVLLRNLRIEERDILQYLPSGLTFVFDGALFYDFNMIINELRLRIRGQYFSAEELFERLIRIANSPEEYLLSQDSEYVMRYLRGVRAEQEEILNQLSAIQTQIAGIVTRQDEFAEQQVAQDAHLDRSDETAQNILDQLVMLRYGVMLLNNRGFFGSMNDVTRDDVMTVVGWKQENPSLTRKEIEQRIKEQELDLSGKEVWLTLILFFNEWE